MSIRVKLLIALLGAALIPLAFAAAAGYGSTVRLGRRVAEDQREALLRDAQGLLMEMMRKNLALFDQEAAGAYATNRLVAREVARLLREPAPEGPPPRPPGAFREGGDAPGLAPSRAHMVIGPDSAQSPALVSIKEPAFYIAPGGSVEDAHRLAGVGEMLVVARPALMRSAYWQFVTLHSGVHMTFPGHGLLPDGYDGRTSPVFQLALSATGSGSPPSIDPATGQTLIGLTHPVRDASGAPIGIVGIQARVDALVEGFEFGAAWGADAETYFVSVEHGPDGLVRAVIVASRAYADQQDGETGFVRMDEFRADDPADTRAVMEALAGGEVGSRVMGVRGEPMLCVYGGMGGDRLGLVTITPVASVAAIAEGAVGRVRAEASAQLVRVLAGVVVLGAIMTAAAFLGARLITRPIAALVGAIRRVADGDLAVRAEVGGGGEVAVLASAFNAMVPRLADQLRMRQSLDLAQQVQRGLLPEAPPAVRGFEVVGVSRYCDETGGDYYDFLEFDQPAPGRLTIAVGDVTGHGVAAALLMATARALIRMRNALPGEMAERLGDINRHLAADVTLGRFMTLMLLTLDRESGVARWVGAGHDPVIVFDPGAGEFLELVGADIPLGIQPDWKFQEREARVVEPGRVLVLGTDGIWEAASASGEQFGKDRLRECIREHAGGSAEAIAAAVLREIGEFIGEEAQRDDITMVVVKVTAP